MNTFPFLVPQDLLHDFFITLWRQSDRRDDYSDTALRLICDQLCTSEPPAKLDAIGIATTYLESDWAEVVESHSDMFNEYLQNHHNDDPSYTLETILDMEEEEKEDLILRLNFDGLIGYDIEDDVFIFFYGG